MRAIIVGGPDDGKVLDLTEPVVMLRMPAVVTALSYAIGQAWEIDTAVHTYHLAAVGVAGVVYQWEHSDLDADMVEDFANDPELWP